MSGIGFFNPCLKTACTKNVACIFTSVSRAVAQQMNFSAQAQEVSTPAKTVERYKSHVKLPADVERLARLNACKNHFDEQQTCIWEGARRMHL